MGVMAFLCLFLITVGGAVWGRRDPRTRVEADHTKAKGGGGLGFAAGRATNPPYHFRQNLKTLDLSSQSPTPDTHAKLSHALLRRCQKPSSRRILREQNR